VVITCKKKRTPAHGKAACPGSYWTKVSPICLNLCTHPTSLSNWSRTMITLLPFLNFHFLARQAAFFFSAASSKSLSTTVLSPMSKLMPSLSSSLKEFTASSQRLFIGVLLEKRLAKKAQLRKRGSAEATARSRGIKPESPRVTYRALAGPMELFCIVVI
jgi:hypothetical protein